MSLDEIYTKAHRFLKKFPVPTWKKERRVLLKIREIVVNRPKEWVIRNEEGDSLTLPKKRYPSPLSLLKSAGTPVATVRGNEIISINVETPHLDAVDFISNSPIGTKIIDSNKSALFDSQKSRVWENENANTRA